MKTINHKTLSAIVVSLSFAAYAEASDEECDSAVDVHALSEVTQCSPEDGKRTISQPSIVVAYLPAEALEATKGEIDQIGRSKKLSVPSIEKGRTGTLEEIVVTAQKRSERLQDVPASISVLGGSQLEMTAPQSLADLNGLVPGLVVTNGGSPGQAQVSLRGISPLAVTGALVGTYIDEAPVGSSTGQIRGALYSPDLMPYDLERVEVLSGPQGTLYGAASMGGLLKYALKTADLTQFSGRVGGIATQVDNSSGFGGGVRAAVNVPLMSNVFGLRISGYNQKTQGYVDNVGLNKRDYNSNTQTGGRIASLWKVTDSLSIRFSAMLQKLESDGQPLIYVDPTTLKSIDGDLATSTDVAETFWQESQFYSLVAEWNLSFATLVSASSWENDDTRPTQDLTPALGALVPILTNGAYMNSTISFPAKRTLDKFTQEFRLVSPSSNQFQWMIGAFYTSEDARNFQPLYALGTSGEQIPGINPFFAGDIPWEYEEIAAFVNGTLRFNDTWSLAAGLRYSVNTQSYSNNVYGALLGSVSPLPPVDFPSTREHVTTWMVSPQWHLSTDTMVYARVATGYRPGGYSFSLPPAPSEYKSDSLTNYELGLKSTLISGRLVVNCSIYDIEWTDIQQDVLDPATNLRYIGNGGDARSRGGELSVSYSLENYLVLGAVLGYTDAQLTEDAPTIGGVSGDRIPGARINGALTADYRRTVNENIEFVGGVAFRALGSTLEGGVESAQTSRRVRQARPLDLYAGFEFGSVNARLFVRNAFNSESRVDYVHIPFAGPLTYIAAMPRTVGLTVDINF